jgi:hypothetical protein
LDCLLLDCFVLGEAPRRCFHGGRYNCFVEHQRARFAAADRFDCSGHLNSPAGSKRYSSNAAVEYGRPERSWNVGPGCTRARDSIIPKEVSTADAPNICGVTSLAH